MVFCFDAIMNKISKIIPTLQKKEITNIYAEHLPEPTVVVATGRMHSVIMSAAI
jgi:hypothetical protein